MKGVDGQPRPHPQARAKVILRPSGDQAGLRSTQDFFRSGEKNHGLQFEMRRRAWVSTLMVYSDLWRENAIIDPSGDQASRE
jgi:hypothetical protein